MKLTISFKNIDHTDSLDSRIKEKSKKLTKYFEGNTNVKWICSAKEGVHISELNLTGPHIEYHAKAQSDNLYKTLDMAISKIEKQIIRKKEKMKNKMHRKKNELYVLDAELAWSDYIENPDEVA
ncbi:MAG: ribosome-associated translation inhibitor RaiA [Halobacteriovoraceae bacterium]|nr:ribosome-associated translation inhibitor RaiA [Halobacteriovoraceae bacterium]